MLNAGQPSVPRRTGTRVPVAAALLLALVAAVPLRAASFNARPYLEGSGYRAERDSVVVYRADSLYMDVDGRRTLLQGGASVSFQGLTLDSPILELDWTRNRVEAWTPDRAVADTCGGCLGLGPGQSLGHAATPGAAAAPAPSEPLPDSLAREAWPVFRDGAQTLYGRRMTLDLKTRQGRVLDGRTAEDPSRYGGARVKRVADREMHVSDAVFTTCDADCPHYHFQARQLKMLLKDKVLARDVFLHFGKVPTLYTPVAMFSLRRGRSSGIILPSYGQTEREGRKLEHFGWYWAASDYWDTLLKLSYAENGPDWLFVSHTPYKLTRSDGGRVSASYDVSRTTSSRGWDLLWAHRQQLTPYVRLAADVSLASDESYYSNTSSNLQTRLRRDLSSNLSLSGTFPKQQIGWTLGARAVQDLADTSGVSISGTAPSFSLRFPNTSPFAFLEDADTGLAAPAAAWLAGGLLSVSSKAESQFDMLGWNLWQADSRRGAQHSASFSVPGKLGVLSLRPQVTARSDWVAETQRLVRREDGGVDTTTVAGFAARNTFSASLSASTKLYGLLRPEVGRLLAIRHVLTPRASLTWTPDFSASRWGYFDEADVAGEDGPQHVKLDRFAGSLYGGTASRRSLSLGFGLDQVFQSKWKAPRRDAPARPAAAASAADSLAPGDSLATAGGFFAAADEPEPLKTDLLSLGTSGSYGFTKESFRLSDLSTRWSASPLQSLGAGFGPLSGLNVSLSTVHTVYKTDWSTGQRIDRYIWLDGYGQAPRLPRLISTSLGVSTRLGGRGGGGDAFLPEVVDGSDGSDRFDPAFGDSDLSIPWDVNVGWSWTENRQDPSDVRRTQTLNASGSLRLSRGWKVGTSVFYDVENQSFRNNSVSIYRDMHCWEGHFVWNPRGDNPGYHLKIAVRSDMLQDLKWDKRKGVTGSGF